MGEGTNRNASRWAGAAGCGVALLLVVIVGWRFRIASENYAIHQHQSALRNGSLAGGWRAERGNGTAKEIVTAKVSQFARSRRKIAEALALRTKVEVPEQVDLFFDAVEAGHWADIDRIFTELQGEMQGEPRPRDLQAVWPPVMETLGVVAETHIWPAERLLDYGEAILSSLTPGMIYVGGTDPGRFVPTLMNATSAGEQHVIITQNALADRLYLDYIRFLYAERVAVLSDHDQEAAFQDYLADARKRLEHDEKFPDDRPQILPGENVSFKNGDDGDVIVGGQISVMAVNERLRRFMEKNPNATFALEESFPLKSTYAEASILGSILQLRARKGDKLTPEKAGKAVAYWRTTAENLEADSERLESSPVTRTWSKMAATHANLFAEHNLLKEAEQTYRLGIQIFSECPEATYGLAQILARTGRTNEAREIAEGFRRQ
jgi:hypothetical protein